MQEIPAMTPVEIDTVLSENWKKQAGSKATLHGLMRAMVRANRQGKPNNYAERIDAEQAVLDALVAEAEPYVIEFAKRPWNRYFLVNNVGGHVHRGMNCSTCFPTTEYQWLVDLADCDENAMIEEWGEMACTVCFPAAPTNPLYNRPSRRDREAREARAAEQAARNAAKAEKSITDVDGSPLRGEYGVIKTKVAARNELSNALQNVAWYGSEAGAALVRKLVPALEAAGVDWRKSAANAVAKVAKEQAKPNPYAHQLTAEQVAENAAKNAASLAQAQALLKEILG